MSAIILDVMRSITTKIPVNTLRRASVLGRKGKVRLLGSDELWLNMSEYFSSHYETIILQLRDHLLISLAALIAAALIGIPGGYMASRSERWERWITVPFQVIRVIPSLAVLVLLIPVFGTGALPAVTALSLLAVPPILINTAVGFKEVPDFMVESARGLGMEPDQELLYVRIPLALPLILAGLRTALVEVIASATLAARIGAGGLGEIIFTGLGLSRPDLLIIGGVLVAMLSLGCGFLFDRLGRHLIKWQYR